MPSVGELVETPLGGGLMQSTAEAHVPFGELTIARNVRQTKNGWLAKRPGNEQVANQYQQPNNAGAASIDVSLGGALSAHGKQLLLTTRNGIAAFSDSYATFNVVQPTSEAALSRSDITIPQIAQGNLTSVTYLMAPAVCSDGTHYFYCWITNASAGFVTIEDIATGDIVQDQIQFAPGATNVVWAVPLMVGTQFSVVWLDTSGNIKLAGMASPYTGLFTVNATLIATVAQTASTIDALALDATHFAIAWGVGTTAARVDSFTAAGVAVNSSGAINGRVIDVRLSLNAGVLWLARNLFANGVDVVSLNPSTLVLTMTGVFVVKAASIYAISVLGTSSTQVAVAYSCADASGFQIVQCDVVDRTLSANAGGFVLHAANTTHSCALASRLFTQNGKFYCWLQVYSDSGSSQNASLYGIAEQNQTQWTYVLADTLIDSAQTSFPHPMRPVAVDAPRFAFAVANRNVTNGGTSWAPLSIVSPKTNQWAAVFGIRASAYVSTWVRTVADFNSSNRWKSIELNGNLLQSGGMVCVWDGNRAFEQGFLHHVCAPIYSVNAGGSLSQPKDYYYKFVPSQTDGAGNLHQGIPSPPLKATTTSTNKTIASTVAPVSLTLRAPYASSSTTVKYQIYYEVFRSQPSPGSAGTDVATNYLDLMPVANGGFVTYTDAGAVSDASSAQNADCYTFGGDLANACPPGALDIVAHQGRAWIIADDGHTLYFSKQIVDGEAVNFCDGLTSPLDVKDGIALASMDEKLVVFSQRRIYYQVGFGPGDNGQQSDYQGFQRVQSPVGCVDRRSVVTTPDGVMFQSPIGIYLLSRGLDVVYVGQPVADEIATYPVIVAAVLHPTQPWVYFYITNAVGNAGERLVYDYRVQKWYTDTLPGVPVSATSTSDGKHYWLDTTGMVWREIAVSDGDYYDNGVWVEMDFETTMHAVGVDGWQNIARMQLLFKQSTLHGLTVQTRPAYGTTYDPGSTWNDAQLSAMVGFTGYAGRTGQVEVCPATSKTNAIAVRVTDSAPTSGADPLSGQGSQFYALAFLTQPDPAVLALVTESQQRTT